VSVRASDEKMINENVIKKFSNMTFGIFA
jgi:hypothetical protein